MHAGNFLGRGLPNNPGEIEKHHFQQKEII
jgi:hypothetical protein